MHPYLQSLIGGLMIGAASAGLLLVNGRIAGISGILSNAAALRPGAWRWAFLGGLAAVGLVALALGRAAPLALTETAPGLLVLGGLIVGVGTQVGNGCTSGHGVCGLSNLSRRSLVATATFMAVAGLTVLFVRHGAQLFGGLS
ncbi:YeeE/YedE family protein [Phenylobacterium soli]|uniref:YeeE/YedE family protein n=1 Tax=Phenylobacterium soli TaxID=2170551 RepID=A0A328AFW9_9CAUL|nr:YeeE/YedE family protein [Phenylobacterium soli]RAK53501.1 YeeE/YedE family protein [Phenylobacterium soli]